MVGSCKTQLMVGSCKTQLCFQVLFVNGWPFNAFIILAHFQFNSFSGASRLLRLHPVDKFVDNGGEEY